MRTHLTWAILGAVLGVAALLGLVWMGERTSSYHWGATR